MVRGRERGATILIPHAHGVRGRPAMLAAMTAPVPCPRTSRPRAVAAAVMSALVAVTGCARLPTDLERSGSSVIPDGGDTPIGRAIDPVAAAHPGGTGFVALGDGRVAFAARVLALRAAARSVDIQVYLWHDDTTGWILFDEVRRAADRGVRVRLLIDDNNPPGLEAVYALLDAHPNVELRLFNPFATRGATRVLGYLTDFRRLNRRMHNKAFVVDDRLAIVGGRNIGDAYFAAGGHATFADLDLAVAGAVVRDVSTAFDRYWNAPSSYPAASLLGAIAPMDADAFEARAARIARDPAAADYARALAASTLVRDLLAGTLEMEWTRARLVVDDPAKVIAPPDVTGVRMLPALNDALGTPRQRLDLVSPYFVPGAEGTAALAALVAQGVRVRVLTNSLAATDVAAVHAGYRKRRAPLLRGGVDLLELRPSTRRPDAVSGAPSGLAAITGSSRASLHAKTFAVDGERVFVGSFNLDPRSAALNTEMGLVVDSPSLARAIGGALDTLHPQAAWRVALDDQGRVRWDDGSATPVRAEPQAGLWRRVTARVLAWLPVEWLL